MERLTKKEKPQLKNFMEDSVCINESTAIKRLWQYENLMEETGIKDIAELKRIITTNAVWEQSQDRQERVVSLL